MKVLQLKNDPTGKIGRDYIIHCHVLEGAPADSSKMYLGAIVGLQLNDAQPVPYKILSVHLFSLLAVVDLVAIASHGMPGSEFEKEALANGATDGAGVLCMELRTVK